MTISTTTIKNSFTGNASTTAFTYTFPINTTAEISVIERSTLGVETIKAEGTGSTNYGIANNGAAGGIVTMVTAPAAGVTLILRRNTALTQETDYVANDPFPAETHEDALDKLQMQTQELQEQADRSFKISRTNTITSSEFTDSASDRANKVLAFDADGEISVTQELGTFKGASATTTTAAFVVRDLVKGTTTAQLNNIYICIKASPIGTALTNTTFWVVIVDAVAAAASATAAAASAVDATDNGAAKVTLAAAQVALATTQAGNSETSKDASVVAKDASVAAKDAAIVAKNAAATSATAAASSADAFDDVYLGTKSSDPSEDNDGDSLAEGMLYFNSTSDSLRVYNGSAFQDAAVDTTTFLTLTATQTLTNKTLTAPAINTAVITSPRVVTSILDSGGNELALLTATGSAVNEFTIANAASGNAPRLSSTGETNVGLDLLAKGTGHVTIRGNTNSGAVQFNCESNTHGQIVKAQPHSAAVTNISLLPAGASSTLVSLVSADTLTNKTLTAPKIVDGGFIADANGNEALVFQTTGSAVNELEITNNAAGSNPILAATGGDTNIGIALTPKGTGEIVIGAGNLNYGGTAITSTGAELNLLDGVSGLVKADFTKLAALTSTAAELNILDDATVTTAELNYSDLATLGTTAASKVFTADANNLTKVSGAVLNTEDTLTDGSTIAWNVINSPVAKVTLGGNRTFAAPSGSTPAAGQFVSLLLIQDGTGSRTITWNAVYEFTGDAAPTLTETANLGDLFTFRYNGAKWLEMGRNLALTLS